MILNINIGILGHVDSGKTTLAKALSTVASTAAFDKNPQSQERKITLDLGFSALTTTVPDHMKNDNYEQLQLTFVDCPGHASLIRTIIGGAQIVDLILLVIDAGKGIQTQTAECLVIAELTCKQMIVVLNKSDSVDLKAMEKMQKKVKNALSTTVFRDSQMIAISALQGDNTLQLIELIKVTLRVPERHFDQPFVMAVDHCFGIKGQGTICTGTVLQGRVKVNDDIEIPKLKAVKKVKSIQMFRRSVTEARQGDRVGCCITQFDPKLLERGLLSQPGYIASCYAAVIKLNRIKYFSGIITSKMKFHMSIGHETIIASITLFQDAPSDQSKPFRDRRFEYVEVLEQQVDATKTSFAILEFEKPVLAAPSSLVIGSKLDINSDTKSCRLAFWGQLENVCTDKNYAENFLPNFKIYKEKTKAGHVQRVLNDQEVIVTGLCKKTSNNRELLIGLKCTLGTREGVIDSSFGQTAKLKIKFQQPLSSETLDQLRQKDCELKIILKFKKFLFLKKNQKIVQ